MLKKWVPLLALLCFSFLPSAYAQDAPASPQLLLIPGILNDFDMSLNRLEENTIASNKIINSLQMKVNSMQTTIDAQQRLLNQVSENLVRSEQTAQEKFKNSEATLQSLETSLITSSQEGKEKDGKILKLTETNAAQARAIFVMGGIIAAVLAFISVKFILWIKGGGAASLIKKICGIAGGKHGQSDTQRH